MGWGLYRCFFGTEWEWDRNPPVRQWSRWLLWIHYLQNAHERELVHNPKLVPELKGESPPNQKLVMSDEEVPIANWLKLTPWRRLQTLTVCVLRWVPGVWLAWHGASGLVEGGMLLQRHAVALHRCATHGVRPCWGLAWVHLCRANHASQAQLSFTKRHYFVITYKVIIHL